MNIKIQENVPLAPYTTFRIGGPAKFFVEVESGEELAEAVAFAQEKKVDFYILGGGRNVLISDQGFQGLIIKINSKLFVAHDVSIGCGAGLPLAKIVNESVKRELTGMEWAVGIPGTIGGAIRGNAGAFGSEIANSIKNVNYIDVNDLYEKLGDKKIVQIKTFEKQQCEFEYRGSIFKKNKNLIILSCVFDLRKGDKMEIETKMRDIIKKRSEKIPKDLSPGSFFKNPETDNVALIRRFEEETGQKVTDHVSSYQYVGNKIKIPAPWLIEECGLKGKRMGGAMVSEKHANFIVNTGGATAEDVVMLASFVKQQVRDKMKVELHEEVQYVGF